MMMLDTVQGVRETACTCDYNLDYVYGEDGDDDAGHCAGCEKDSLHL